MSNINTIIYAGVGLVVLIISTLLYNSFQAKKLEIATLKQEVSSRDVLIAKLEAGNVQNKTLIAKQNEEIKKITKDRKEALNELEEWRAKPPKIKYQVIYKDREVVKSNDCEDIKNRLDDIRAIDFNSL